MMGGKVAIFLLALPLVMAASTAERFIDPLADDPHKIELVASGLILVGLAVAFFGARVYRLMSLVFGFISFFHFGFYSTNMFLSDNPTLLGVCIAIGVIGGAITYRFAKIAKATVGLVSGVLVAYLAYLACLNLIPSSSGNLTVLLCVCLVFGVVGVYVGVKATQNVLTIMTAYVGAFMVAYGIDLLTDNQLSYDNLEHHNLNGLGYGLIAIWLAIGSIGIYYQLFTFSLCLRQFKRSKSLPLSDTPSGIALSEHTRLVSPLLSSGGTHHVVSQLYGSQNAEGRCGLANTGNTCFVNATVQALYAVDPLRQHMTDPTISLPLPPSRMPRALGVQIEAHRPVSELLGRVMRQLANPPSSSLSPSELKSMTSKFSFNDGRQHDASEFMRCILNGLVEDPVASQIYKDMFSFKTCGVVTCSACGHESTTEEDCLDLTLEIATDKTRQFSLHSSTLSLESLISAYFTATRFEGENLYQCDKCEGKREATRTTHLASIPQALVLSLNRFRYSSHSMRRVKVLDQVLLPEMLTIGKHSLALSSIVIHSGPSAEGGHYYAFSRLPTSSGLKQWYRFDDRSVTEMSFCQVREACRTMAMDSAYVLIYSRAE